MSDAGRTAETRSLLAEIQLVQSRRAMVADLVEHAHRWLEQHAPADAAVSEIEAQLGLTRPR